MPTAVPDTLFELVLQDGRTYHTGPGGSVGEWNHSTDYLTATDGWSCSFTSKNKADRDLLQMAPVEIRVDGRPQMVGRIDGTVKGKNGSQVDLRGRDYLADATECGIDPTVIVKAGDKLDKAILLALHPVGIFELEDPEVKMERRTGKAPKKLPKLVQADMHDTKREPGDGSFEWANRIAARHGYTIQPATARNKVCLEEPNYIQDVSYSIIRRDTDKRDGNVIEAFADEDYSSFPTFATMVGGSGKATEKLGRSKFDWDLWAITKATGPEVSRVFDRWTISGRRIPATCDPLIAGQLYRFMYFRDKHAKTSSQIVEATWRAACEQLKKTLVYECTIKGTRDPRTGLTYAVNTMASVDDDLADVHESLWVASCSKGTGKDGTVTKMKMWRPWSFQVGKGGHGNG